MNARTIEGTSVAPARTRRRTPALAASLLFALCGPVSTFAQSHTERRWDVSPALAHDMRRTSLGVVRVYGTDSLTDPRDVVPPANLVLPDLYHPLVRTMLERSAVFRRQCARIANARDLTVAVRSAPAVNSNALRLRARTQMWATQDRRMRAEVEILSLGEPAELIAHELEHVIEQLDGIDLPRRATLPRTGVRLCDDGAYETRRAMSVGQAVAREVRASRN